MNAGLAAGDFDGEGGRIIEGLAVLCIWGVLYDAERARGQTRANTRRRVRAEILVSPTKFVLETL